MTPVLIVVFELGKGESHEPLVRAIKQNCKTWARVTSTAYVIETEQKAVDIRNKLQQHLSTKDRLFIGTAPAPAAWYNLPEDVGGWIIAHQVGGTSASTTAK
ncbi:MAG: hypothetical protein ACJ8NS_02040 [Chthoniobacterales bacterium]